MWNWPDSFERRNVFCISCNSGDEIKKMNTCNDPKCSLNRQGISHEIHELIENRPVKNPCNDPRCAMNRMGMRHEAHDGKRVYDEQIEQENPSESRQYFEDNVGTDSFDEYVQELSRGSDRGHSSQSYKPPPRTDYPDDSSPGSIHKGTLNEESKKTFDDKIVSERTKNERQKIEQQAREEIKRRETLKDQSKEKSSTKSRVSSRPKNSQNLPSINQILQGKDPYVIFDLPRDTTCNEIKSKFKELSRTYNASSGIMNKTLEEKEQLTRIQSRINIVFDFLKKRHCN